MDLLIIMSSPDAEPIAGGIARAAGRAGIKWGIFFTNDGVRALDNAGLVDALTGADMAVACQDSWQQHMKGATCPVELGSQTNNSLAVSQTKRIISL